VGDRRTDERRAKIERFAADEVRTAVDANIWGGDVSSNGDVERAFVGVTTEHVDRAAERAGRRRSELNRENDRRARSNGGVPKAGDQRIRRRFES